MDVFYREYAPKNAMVALRDAYKGIINRSAVIALNIP
jgi:hypothetical protein